MKEIAQIRKLSLWIFFTPLLAINLCLLISQNYEILENLGVEILKDEFKTPFYNEETMETNVEGVFLAGVICGGLKTNKWFIENSRDHSEKIISQITKT